MLPRVHERYKLSRIAESIGDVSAERAPALPRYEGGVILYRPRDSGGPGRILTYDQRIMSPLL